MKKKEFIIEEYCIEQQEKVKKLLLELTKEENVYLSIRLKYYEISFDKNLIDSIADTIKAIGKQREFVTEILLETNQWKQVKKLRKRLNQYGISVELEVADTRKLKEIMKYKTKLLLEKIILPVNHYHDFLQAYHKWKETGLTIRLKEMTLSRQEYLDFWEEWIHDKSAAWFEPYENMILSILTGTSGSECEHSSCMGRILYLDREENLYFCAKKKDAAKMCSLKENIPDFIYNEVYDHVLKMAVEKRSRCTKECQMFGICRGGCPFDTEKETFCADYLQKVSHIGNFIEKEIGTHFSEVENPRLRQLYLTLIAYGFGFEADGLKADI